jgi:hypothetical protein
MRAEVLRLMRRHVSSLRDEGLGHVSAADAVAALRDAYGAALGAQPSDGALTDRELAAVERWEQRLTDPGWLRGPAQPARLGRRVKVRSDVFVVRGERAGVHVLASIVGDTIAHAAVTSQQLNGGAAALERALVGSRAERAELAALLAPFGDAGDHVLHAMTPALEERW